MLSLSQQLTCILTGALKTGLYRIPVNHLTMTPAIRYLILLLTMPAIGLTAKAQSGRDIRDANKRLNSLQTTLSKLIDKQAYDPNEKAQVARFINTEIDSLQDRIKNDNSLTAAQKLISINAQSDFLDSLRIGIGNSTVDASFILDNRTSFMQLSQSIATPNSFSSFTQPLTASGADMMAGIFKKYPQAEKLKDIAMLKRLEGKPENIMSFLSNNSNFSFRDSLIYIFGSNRPEMLVNYVQSSRNNELVNLIRSNPSTLIKTLLSLTGEKNLKNYLPFLKQISEQQLQPADIDKLRGEPSRYFKTLVDAEISNFASGADKVTMESSQRYLHEYAKTFFTDIINSLHEETDKVRFAVLEGMRAQDLYYIITTGEDELYTSSYLYTYKKLMQNFDKNNADSLLTMVKNDMFRKFLLMAGRYNTLSAFLHQMPNEQSIAIIKKMLQGLENSDKYDIGEIINAAEAFPGIVSDEGLAQLTLNEINSNYTRWTAAANKNGIRVYSVLTDLFNLVKGNETGVMSEIPQAAAPYYRVSHNSLRGKDGRINQVVVFFGDEDGKSSYASFLSNYSDASQWTIEKNSNWVKISSKKLYPMSIYANLPLDNDLGKDLLAQDSLLRYLKRNQVEPHVLILRGHSYHLINSFKFFSPSIRLAILGSCGGYREITEILRYSPHVQVISTKQIGSKQVNEPMLKYINTMLLNEKELAWSTMWDQLESQFVSKKQAYEYFREYIPPYKNIPLLVTALFKNTVIQ